MMKIENFADFCLQVFVVVDDIWQQIVPFFKRPGPEPACSDSELITMALVAECKGWDRERVLISSWRGHTDLRKMYLPEADSIDDDVP